VNTGSRTFGPGSDWQAIIERLALSGLSDIYFDHRYVTLYVDGGARAEGFLYEDGGEAFFLANVVRPIDSVALSEPAFDFETAYGYGGPLATTEDRQFLGAAWLAFVDHCRSHRIVAGFLRFHPLLGNHRFATGTATVRADRDTVVLDLNRDRESVQHDFAKDNRQKIRKATRAGVTVTSSTTPQALQTFAELYESRMKELGADTAYFFGHAYFQGIANLGAERFRVYLAVVDGDTIGGALILCSDRFVHYHLSASPQAFRGYAPNNMLRYAVIMDSVDGGHKTLHFGGGRTSSPEDGLLKFKRKFSQETARFHVGSVVTEPELYDTLCDDWRRRHPDMVARFGERVLCYRYR
jgi:hypothetical protein